MGSSTKDGVVSLADLTGGLPPVRRRQLGGVVIAAVSGCALILVAAAITRVSHASSAPRAEVIAPPAAAAGASDSRPGSTGDVATPATTEAAPAEIPATGTLRLERPSVLGRVWLDGKKLASASESVACGKHQVKVGGWKTHAIDVPCGGELVLSR